VRRFILILVFLFPLLILAEDKHSNFDIPPEASDPSKSRYNFPHDREMHFCACPAYDINEQDYLCVDSGTQHREFYYFIKIENWGERDTGEVIVINEFDAQLKYIPDSTEFATKYDPALDSYTNWIIIPDKSDKVFPLSGDGIVISEKMTFCNKQNWTCKDSILIRYKVIPHRVKLMGPVTNSAKIIDKHDGSEYFINRSIPLRLRPVECVRDTECPSPTPDMCGGVGGCPECGDGFPDCPEGMKCEDEKCVDDETFTCTDSIVNLKEGKNSPKDRIISKNNDGNPLVVGQFTLRASNCDDHKFFNFDWVKIDVSRNIYNIFNNLSLYHDVNGNGFVDDEDRLLSQTEIDLTSAWFYLSKKNRKFQGQTLNHFIITSEIDHNDEIVKQGTKFNFAIESPEYIKTSDMGETVVVGDKIDFAQFTIEPTGNFFIVTRGLNDPFPPANKTETRGIVPVIQLRTKSVKGGDILNSITIRTTEKSAKFKEGIDKAYLYLDMDGDGKISSSDMKVYEVSEIENGVLVFDNLQLSYDDGEEKQLVIALALNLKTCGMAQIEVVEAGLKVDGKSEVMGLPISSREFIYQCNEPGDPDYIQCDELDQNNDSVPDTASKTKGCSVLVF
jgi:hypothetical protein